MILCCWSNEYIFYLSEPKRGVSFYSTMILERFLVFIRELVWVLHFRQLIQENNLIRHTVPTVSITNTSTFDLGGKKTNNSQTSLLNHDYPGSEKPLWLFTWISANHLRSSLFLFLLQTPGIPQRGDCKCKRLLTKFTRFKPILSAEYYYNDLDQLSFSSSSFGSFWCLMISREIPSLLLRFT